MQKLTRKEIEWIQELERLLSKKPKHIRLFATGELQVLKATKEFPECRDGNGYMKRDLCVYTIFQEVDGGDF